MHPAEHPISRSSERDGASIEVKQAQADSHGHPFATADAEIRLLRLLAKAVIQELRSPKS